MRARCLGGFPPKRLGFLAQKQSFYLILCIFPDNSLAAMSHPPHFDQNYSASMSALIPFCAFKTSMLISEPPSILPDISYPLCSSFKPSILEGQLCYELKLNTTSGEGKEDQLMLLIDYNEDRSIYAPNNQTANVSPGVINTLNMDDTKDLFNKEAKIHIGTLSSFKGFGGGTYKMTAVKKMTVTDDFLNMPLNVRKCEVQPFEECRSRKLRAECRCVHGGLKESQVRTMEFTFTFS